jgi:hypothetical protein
VATTDGTIWESLGKFPDGLDMAVTLTVSRQGGHADLYMSEAPPGVDTKPFGFSIEGGALLVKHPQTGDVVRMYGPAAWSELNSSTTDWADRQA